LKNDFSREKAFYFMFRFFYLILHFICFNQKTEEKGFKNISKQIENYLFGSTK
jgi:hypothetical protein